MEIKVDIDERDVVEQTEVSDIIDWLGVEALLSEIGEKAVIEYFELKIEGEAK